MHVFQFKVRHYISNSQQSLEDVSHNTIMLD